MKDPLINILISLYGEGFRKDFEEHLELLKDINNYYRRKRAEIEEDALVEFKNITWWNNADYVNEDYENDANSYLKLFSYSMWFKEVFIEDYNNALIEVEEQTIPSNRELCILRIAREAVYKYVDVDNLYKFCREYLIDTNEYSIFWNEYYYCKQLQNSSTGRV